MKLRCRGLHKNLLDSALAPLSTELQVETGRQLREKPLMQKDDFKHTLGKIENKDDRKWQEVHDDKSEREEKNERSINPIPKAGFFACS